MKLLYTLTVLLILTGCEETRSHGIVKRLDPASERRFFTECLKDRQGNASNEDVVECGKEAATLEWSRAEASYYRDKFANQIARSNP